LLIYSGILCFSLKILINYRTSNLDINAKIGPGVDLGWISSTAVSLFYGQVLIGEASIEDKYIIPEDNNIHIELNDVEIRDMFGFKTFIQHIMPQVKREHPPESGAPAVALEIVENGHKLSMTINLDSLGTIKTTIPTVRRTLDEIEITFSLQNPTAVEIYFGETHFILQRDGVTVARLQGRVDIDSGCNPECVLKGKIQQGRMLFGKAILKGAGLESKANTWLIHAIRQFEIEVNLDEMAACEN
jgi:hypothetical protein